MQNIKTHWDSVAFGKFLAEVQGFLRTHFGVAANPAGITMATDYFARGRSAIFCAYALARHDGLAPGGL